MKTLFKLLSSSALFCCSALAQQDNYMTQMIEEHERKYFDPLGSIHEAGRPKNVMTHIEFIELPHTTMTSLLYGPNILKSGDQHRKEVEELIQKGTATIIESTLSTDRPGETSRFSSESIFIYPTEYDPAVVKPGKVNKDGSRTEAIAVGPLPTAFEERPAGTLIELEPKVGYGEDGHLISLDFEAELTSWQGRLTWSTWKDKRGEANVAMPRFYQMSIKTSITLEHGKYQLVGILSPSNKDGQVDRTRKVMVFVRSIVRIAGK